MCATHITLSSKPKAPIPKCSPKVHVSTRVQRLFCAAFRTYVEGGVLCRRVLSHRCPGLEWM